MYETIQKSGGYRYRLYKQHEQKSYLQLTQILPGLFYYTFLYPFYVVLFDDLSVKYTLLTREEVIQAVMQICPENFDSFIRGIVERRHL